MRIDYTKPWPYRGYTVRTTPNSKFPGYFYTTVDLSGEVLGGFNTTRARDGRRSARNWIDKREGPHTVVLTRVTNPVTPP